MVGETGSCVKVNGDYVTVDGVRAEGCGYAGFSVYGDHGMRAECRRACNNAAGIQVGKGSDFGSYSDNTLTGNNVMNVNTPGVGCGTPGRRPLQRRFRRLRDAHQRQRQRIFGKYHHRLHRESYDFSHDGAAFEIFNGSRNNIHHNMSVDNNVFSEIGRSNGTARRQHLPLQPHPRQPAALSVPRPPG